MSWQRRRWLEAAIVLVWIAMSALLWRREREAPLLVAEPAAQAAPAGAGVQWLGIFKPGGERVGHVRVGQAAERRHELDGAATSLEARLKLGFLGQEKELRLDGDFWQAGDRADLDFRAASHDYQLQFVGAVQNGKLTGEVRSAGEAMPIELPVDRHLLLGNGLGATLRFPACEDGQRFGVKTLDPLTLRAGIAQVTCREAAERELAGSRRWTRRLEIASGGLELEAWVDAQGVVLRTETPLGLVLEVIDPAELLRPAATKAAPDDGSADLALATSVSPTGKKPFRAARRMVVRLEGAPPPPEDPWQARRADGAWVLDIRVAGTADAAAPPEALAPDALVQSRHPAIVAQAREIVGAEKDPARQAALLGEWVFTRIDKEAVLAIPSALEVLERRRGDCNEHTVLFTALARAAGLPTRIAIGLVWSDELEGFYYHAWPEVWLQGGWHPLDPTLGQPRADATHLALLHGGIQEWPRVLPYFGKLKIDVLEVE